MCRHLAYVGTPIDLHAPLFGSSHSLCAQARHPRHQETGDTNPDGWGVGWYADGAVEPELYRTVTSVWDDRDFAASARTITTGAFLAAARLASPGAAVTATGNAPFRSGRWLFSLNGIVRGFHDDVGPGLRARVSAARRAQIVGDTDSEVLFAMVLDRLDAGEPPAVALGAVAGDVHEVATARINLLLTDGTQIAATRSGRSLFVRGSTIVSEPLDDGPGWREVPEGATVTVAAAGEDAQVTIGAR
ncbi:MAG TPA: class II glutamine amidotransferase [Acidimicrobiia bacterium]|nr:class II glutamine amidotransferase [Acidimicrobiia bacterium]